MITEEEEMVYLGCLKFCIPKQNWRHWLLSNLHQPPDQKPKNSHEPKIYLQKLESEGYFINSIIMNIEKDDQSFSIPIGDSSRYITLLNFIQRDIIQIRNLQNVPINPKPSGQSQYTAWVQKQIESEMGPFLIAVEVFVIRLYLEQCNMIYDGVETMFKNKKNQDYLKLLESEKILGDFQNLNIKEFIGSILPCLQSRQSIFNPAEINPTQQKLQPSKLPKFDAEIVLQFKSDSEVGVYFDLPDTIKPTETPPDFSGSLKDYQKKTLTWMLARQDYLIDTEIDMSDCPFWKSYRQQLKLPYDLYSLNYVNKNLLAFNRKVNKHCQGGILADQMGLGKTIMMISLMLTHRPKSRKRQTLIIVPTQIVQQWLREIRLYTKGQLKVFFHQGATSNNVDITPYDVVVTTETIIRVQHNKKFCSKDADFEEYKLIDNEWFRVILDEAHSFKNHQSRVSLALYSLLADYRWCLTGTPIQNSLNDMFFMVKFLRFEPWCNENFWKQELQTQINSLKRKGKQMTENDLNLGNTILIKQIFKGIMVRRKKNSKNNQGEKILSLPQLTTYVSEVEMELETRQLYRIIKQMADRQWLKLEQLKSKYTPIGLGKIRDKILNIFQVKFMRSLCRKLLKLRQLCCHNFLYMYTTKPIDPEHFESLYLKFLSDNRIKPRKIEGEDKNLTPMPSNNDSSLQHKSSWHNIFHGIANSLQKEVSKQCLICCYNCIQGVISPCLHIFCKECIQGYVDEKLLDYLYEKAKENKDEIKQSKAETFETQCPICSQLLILKQLFPLPQINHFNRPYSDFLANSKINKLITYITSTKPEEKCLVYTSFVGMAKLLEYCFNSRWIAYETIKGQDSMTKREKSIRSFNNNKAIKVLIMTLKTGAVGLNLQSANHVYLMDPWWNPAIQEQAMCRAHRIGQEKDVKVYRIITKESIESRMLKIGVQKKLTADAILDFDDGKVSYKNINQRNVFKYILNAEEDEALLKENQEELEQKESSMFENLQKESNEMREDVEKFKNSEHELGLQNSNPFSLFCSPRMRVQPESKPDKQILDDQIPNPHAHILSKESPKRLISNIFDPAFCNKIPKPISSWFSHKPQSDKKLQNNYENEESNLKPKYSQIQEQIIPQKNTHERVIQQGLTPTVEIQSHMKIRDDSQPIQQKRQSTLTPNFEQQGVINDLPLNNQVIKTVDKQVTLTPNLEQQNIPQNIPQRNHKEISKQSYLTPRMMQDDGFRNCQDKKQNGHMKHKSLTPNFQGEKLTNKVQGRGPNQQQSSLTPSSLNHNFIPIPSNEDNSAQKQPLFGEIYQQGGVINKEQIYAIENGEDQQMQRILEMIAQQEASERLLKHYQIEDELARKIKEQKQQGKGAKQISLKEVINSDSNKH